MPLCQEGAELKLEVALEARREAGIDSTTLEHKVRETLSQIGAKIIEESLERENRT